LGPALFDAYKAINKGASFELETAGSGSGLTALLEGQCDIASSSRPPNEDELRLARSRDIHFAQNLVGYYGIAIIVSKDHPVKALTDKQVEGIFTGKITNWKKVGGPDAEINVYIRDASSGTYLGFQELAMNHQSYTDEALEKPTYHEIRDAVREDPNGIGFVGFNLIAHDGVRGMIINGIHPNASAVNEGLYPYARLVRLIVDQEKATRSTWKFIKFVQSREGQKVVESVGFVPCFASRLDFGGHGY